MRAWLPAGLAAASMAVLLAVPGVGGRRLADLHQGRPPAGWRSLWLLVPLPVLLVAGPVAAGLACVAAAAYAATARRRRAAGDRRHERAAALDALAVLGADLRAGRTPAEALDGAASVATGPSAQAFAAAAAAARLGGDAAAALAVPDSAVPDVLRGLAACWTVCSSAGSGLAAGVERLEEGLRSAEAQRRAVEGELAGPRATAALLAVLPLGGVGLAAALGADPLHLLLHTPLGLACLVGGFVLDGLGLFWTARLVARALPA